MVEIKRFGPIRLLRSDASAHVILFSNGQARKSGRGLSFWFWPDRASIAHLPTDDRELPFIFKGRSKDFQEVTIQGAVTWRVADAAAMASRLDFSIDLKSGLYIGRPMDQIDGLLTGLAQQISAQYLAEHPLAEVLTQGIKVLNASVELGLTGNDRLLAMGVEVISVRVADLAPSSEMERALQTPTVEKVQQQADQAVFERRALAVEKERAIAENELHNKIELARREEELITRESANSRQKAEAEAEASRIAADAQAANIRVIDQARADMESAHVQAYAGQPAAVVFGLAVQELAGKINSIEHLNITPDMFSTLLADAVEKSTKKGG